jgi:hypothetical protein
MLIALSHGPAAALAAEEIASHGHSHAIADDGVFPGTMRPITNTSSRSFPVAAKHRASMTACFALLGFQIAGYVTD